MRTAILCGAAALLTTLASGAQAATVEWVVGSVTLQSGAAVARGQNVPDNASITVAAGARVKVNFANGSSEIIQGARTVNLSTLGGGGSMSGGMASLGQSSSRVGAVAGVRASEAAEAVNPLSLLTSSSGLPGERDAVASATDAWSAGNRDAAIGALRAFYGSHTGAWIAGYQLGVWLNETGGYAESATVLGQVAEVPRANIDMPNAVWNYMVALQASGKYTESSQVAQRAINSYPDDPDQARWHLVIAMNAAQTGDAATARRLANDAAALAMTHVRELVRQLQGDGSEVNISAALTDDARYQVDSVVVNAREALDNQERILDIRRRILSTVAQ